MDKKRIALCKGLLPKLKKLANRRNSRLANFILFVCGLKPGLYVEFGCSKDEAVQYISNLRSTFRSPLFYVKIVGPHTETLSPHARATSRLIELFLCNRNDKRRIAIINRLVELFPRLTRFDIAARKEADKLFGELFGYPQCCIKHYSRAFQAGSLNSPYRNFVFHGPCERSCKKSIELAQTYAGCVKAISLSLYRKILKGEFPHHTPWSHTGTGGCESGV